MASPKAVNFDKTVKTGSTSLTDSKSKRSTKKKKKKQSKATGALVSPYLHYNIIKYEDGDLNFDGPRGDTKTHFWVYKRSRSHSIMAADDERAHLIRMGMIPAVTSQGPAVAAKKDPLTAGGPLSHLGERPSNRATLPSTGLALPESTGAYTPTMQLSSPQKISVLAVPPTDSPVNIEVEVAVGRNAGKIIGKLLAMRETSLLGVRRLLLRFSRSAPDFIFLDAHSEPKLRAVQSHNEERMKVAEVAETSEEQVASVMIESAGVATVKLFVKETRTQNSKRQLMTTHINKERSRQPKLLAWASKKSRDKELSTKLALKGADFDMDRSKPKKAKNPLPQWLSATDEEIEHIVAELGFTKSEFSSPHPEVMTVDAFFESAIRLAQTDDCIVRKAFGKIYNIRNWLQRIWIEMDEAGPKPIIHSADLTREEVQQVVNYIDKNGDGVDLSELDQAFRMVTTKQANLILNKGATAAMAALLAYMNAQRWTIHHLTHYFQVESEDSKIGMHQLRALLKRIFLDVLDTPGEEATVSSVDEALITRKRREEAIEVLCMHFDRGHEGYVYLAEFLRAFRIAEKSIRHQSLEAERLFAAEQHHEAVERIPETVEMTTEDITRLLKWMDTDGDGLIDLPELEKAFRSARRAAAEQHYQKEGRELMQRLKNHMTKKNLTVKMWFDLMDSAGEVAGYYKDGKITTRELTAGLRQLVQGNILPKSKRSKVPEKDLFTHKEIVTLVRFMDFSGDGELHIDEVRYGFDKLEHHELTEHEQLQLDMADVLDRVMKALKGLRLKDFFSLCDEEERGTITADDLKENLERLLQPPASLRALAKRRERELNKLREEYAGMVNLAIDAAVQLEEIENAGVGEVLRRLSAHIKSKGLKIADLFHQMDTSGDGLLDAEEVVDMLSKISQPSFEALESMKIRERKLKRRKMQEEETRRHYNDMMTRMAFAEQSGAALVLERLESFMRSNQMRMIDLFRRVDTSGDGQVDSGELAEVLKQLDIKASAHEVQKLVDYLDTSGDGQIDHQELEDAIRYFRRYRWEKRMAEKYSSEGKLPLYLKYRSLNEIFSSSDDVMGRLSADDVRQALKKLRGDMDVVSEPAPLVQDLTAEERMIARRAAHELSEYLKKHFTTMHAHFVKLHVPMENGFVTIAGLRKWISAIQMETGQTALDLKAHRYETTDPEGLRTEVSKDQIDRVMNILDPNDNGIELDELRGAFHMIKKTNAHALMEQGVCAAIGFMKRFMAAREKQYDEVFSVLEQDDRGRVSCESLRQVLEELVKDTEPTPTPGQELDEEQQELFKMSLEQLKAHCINVIEHYLDRSMEGSFLPSKLVTVSSLAEEREKYDMILQKRDGLEHEKEVISKQLQTGDKMSEEAIQKLMSYLDPHNQGVLEFFSLAAAFRRIRRARAEHHQVAKGKRVMKKLRGVIESCKMTPETWFKSMDDQSRGSSDGCLTMWELKKGLRDLMLRAKQAPFTENEVQCMVRFMDRSAEGDLSLAEVQDGFARIDEPSAAEAMELEIGDIINKVEGVLKDRRLVDFFRELDTEKTAKITTKTLQNGLNRLLRPTAFLTKRLEEKEKLIHPLLSQYEQLEVKTVESATKIVHFERSGVAAIVRNLEGRMKERGMRIHDFFAEMDVDGDGSVSGPELSKMLTLLLQPPADVQAAVKIRQQKTAASQAVKEAAAAEAIKLEAELKRAEESGAHVAMAAFAEYMRVHACRVIDVFRMIDSSGDGVCDLEELNRMITIVGLDMNEEDMKKMMDYLDDDGSGSLDAEELNRAVRDFRRAKWARRMVAVAKQAKYATTLDRGIINRREANILIKYLSYCYTVKRIPVVFLENVLAANKELRKEINAAISSTKTKEEPRMGYPWQAKVTYKGEAANFKELWPDTLTATTYSAAMAPAAALGGAVHFASGS